MMMLQQSPQMQARHELRCTNCGTPSPYFCKAKAYYTPEGRSRNQAGILCINCVLRKSSLTHKPLRHLFEPCVVNPSGTKAGDVTQLYYRYKSQTSHLDRHKWNSKAYKNRSIQNNENQEKSENQELAFALVCSNSVSGISGEANMWPDVDVKIRVNGETVFPKARETYIILDKNSFVNDQAEIVIEADVSALPYPCYFTVFTVQTRTSSILSQLSEQLKMSLEGNANVKKQTKIYKQALLAHKELRFSPICPFSLKTMETPARMVRCRHAQCFGLETVIGMISMDLMPGNRICCPICCTRGVFSDVLIDFVQLRVLEQLKTEVQKNSQLNLSEYMVCLFNPYPVKFELRKIRELGVQSPFSNQPVLPRL